MKKNLWIVLFIFPFSAFAQAPKDFQFTYYSSAGQLENGTVEKVVVKDNVITQHREAVELGEGGGKKNFDKTFKINSQQTDELYRIIQTSGFFTWPQKSDVSHQSQVVEEIEVKAEGKTTKRNRWELGLEDSFRKLYQDYDRWLISVQSARF